MKILIKSVLILFSISILMICTLISAGAASNDTIADRLHELGLFAGSTGSYELDREPTRTECAVMLVRLLGKEGEVKTGEYTHPFTDVPDWANNYVGFLYQNNLLKGTSDTTFGADDKCSSKMFVTLVLRALGYSDSNGDFSYSNSLEYAAQIGLIPEKNSLALKFTRSNLVDISYSAIFLPTKTSDKTSILETLTANGSVKKETAEKYLSYYDIYKRYSYAVNSSINKSMDAKVIWDMKANKSDTSYNFSLNLLMKKIVTDQIKTASFDYTLNDNGTQTKCFIYYNNGYSYAKTGTSKIKAKQALNQIQILNLTRMNPDPFCFIDKITENITSTATTYCIDYSNDFINIFLSSTIFSDSNNNQNTTGTANRTAVFENDGNLKKETSVFELTSSQNGETVNLHFESNTEVNAIGSSVKITPPSDLDEYIDISPKIEPDIKT